MTNHSLERISADATWMCCLPSAAQRLCLTGGAAASVKFMPVLPHARASLAWLWSVVRLQGLHNLYGLRWAAAGCPAGS